jgi:hypothetical protein
LRIARSTSFEAPREYRRAMVVLHADPSWVETRFARSGHSQPTETTANRRYLFHCACAALRSLFGSIINA